MAHRIWASRHGKLINRAHLDRDYPYRYKCDPIRYLARTRAAHNKNESDKDIAAGLEDYYHLKTTQLS